MVVRGDIMNVPCEAGVYMLCTFPPRCSSFGGATGLFNALYVGRANNLRGRFKNYQRRTNISDDAIYVLDELLEEGKVIYFVFSIVPMEQLRKTEGHLIRCLGPSVNKRDEIILQAKVGRPIPV